MTYKFSSALLLGALTMAGAAQAQTAASTVAKSTDTIIVTGQRALDAKAEAAGRLGLTIRETPATVDIITQQDFKPKVHAQPSKR